MKNFTTGWLLEILHKMDSWLDNFPLSWQIGSGRTESRYFHTSIYIIYIELDDNMGLGHAWH